MAAHSLHMNSFKKGHHQNPMLPQRCTKVGLLHTKYWQL
jgi:hypothetical protein